jgi:phosphomannomutase
MSVPLTCFKAYDIRGRIPDQLNEEIAYRIGRATADYLDAKKIIVGRDIRLTSESIAASLIRGINDAGCDVIDIGLGGTEEVYFATFNNDVDGGIAVTASHNPKDYNGMKLVRRGAQPISGDTGLKDIQKKAEEKQFKHSDAVGKVTHLDSRPEYIRHLLTYVDTSKLKPLKIVCNAGNGGAGLVIDAIESQLPIQFVKVHHQPDGNFPNGVPNPLLEENRQPTIDAVIKNKADFGIAWDGDFDRCFFFDESGNFIEGYYIVGLLAETFLKKKPGAKIIHDPRLTWNTIDIVSRNGGVAIQSKTGHAFIKERMRAEDAIYGGEMSAHHYFKDFAYCDSGMIPWLLIAELVSTTGRSLSQLVSECMAAYPASGEINNTVDNPAELLQRIESIYSSAAISIDHVDGLSVEYGDWRFNLRMSNTEPVVRLNVESRNNVELMQKKTKELLKLIES